jgi:hypothetical protein
LNYITCIFSKNSHRTLYILQKNLFYKAVVFSCAEWFGRESERVCFYFCSTERNSELFSLPLNVSEGNSVSLLLSLFHERNSELFSLSLMGLEWNSESLLLFLFHGTEFRDVFSPTEGFGTEFREFLFRGTAGIPSEITICSDYSVFHGIIPNPNCASLVRYRSYSELVLCSLLNPGPF